MRESEYRLSEAERIAHLGYWEYNLDTDHITWSEETARIFGQTLHELSWEAEAVREMIHPDDRQIFDDAVVRARQGESDFKLQYRVVRPSSEERYVEILVDVIRDETGRPVRAVGAVQDFTERKQAEEQIKANNEQLRALSAHVQSAREEEAKRIAREIHDELGAALSSLKWDLEEIDEVLSESTDPSKLTALRDKVGVMVRLTDTTIDTVRRITSELRPTALDELGLVEALRWHAQQFQARTGIIVRFDDLPEGVDLIGEQATAVFRIVQEALTNVLRHAQATRVDITMKREEGFLVLTVRDDGRGITDLEKAGTQSLGLLGMRERASLLGGEIRVDGTEGAGIIVTLRIPAYG